MKGVCHQVQPHRHTYTPYTLLLVPELLDGDWLVRAHRKLEKDGIVFPCLVLYQTEVWATAPLSALPRVGCFRCFPLLIQGYKDLSIPLLSASGCSVRHSYVSLEDIITAW